MNIKPDHTSSEAEWVSHVCNTVLGPTPDECLEHLRDCPDKMLEPEDKAFVGMWFRKCMNYIWKFEDDNPPYSHNMGFDGGIYYLRVCCEDLDTGIHTLVFDEKFGSDVEAIARLVLLYNEIEIRELEADRGV